MITYFDKLICENKGGLKERNYDLLKFKLGKLMET